MKIILVLIACTCYCTSSHGQLEPIQQLSFDSLLIKNLTQFHLENPISLNGEVFTTGVLDYKISKKTSIGLERNYAKFGTHEQISPYAVFKHNLNDKTYLFVRGGKTYDINQQTGSSEGQLINVNLGVGFRLKKKMILEVGLLGARSSIAGLPPANQYLFTIRLRF
ncbi:hypothetical protein N9Y48_02450 [Zobellia sp.]|nr:hypothetical protein [Zobellia sp.]